MVPVIDAAATVEALRAGGNGQDCGGCSVTLVDPVFGEMTLATAYGEAVVPAWEFTIAGTPARLARVAVAPDHLLTVDAVPGLTEATGVAGFAPELGEARITGPASVRVLVAGGTAPCHQGFTTQTVETAHTFTVAVATIGDFSATCTAMAQLYPVDVPLAAPIGDRIMIDVGLGTVLELER
ncbi:hypothetical protein [Nakamurella leprariae]|uniref:Uncharacterized protein n=1 Tax=Nakamurella leprariae TaxID=2803911 RepID=A0A939BVP4_9ACTN|nr:hypothetical protein [Nakamurella leprariae]MBM9466733.1 hypothetical protein [Nakamurella leprariae]